MSFHTIYFILLVSSVSSILSRHVPRYSELEDDDQQLFRAAYDTPSYDQQEYDEEEDLQPGKLDLVKDGLWALKAKIKELKTFDKTLAAHLLETKLKLKDLLKNHLAPIKNHHHEAAKPSYGYPAPSYQAPAYSHYEQPQPYASQPQQYAIQPQQYASQPQQYAPQSQQYPSQPQQYAASPVIAAFPAPAVAYPHDPYYGH